MISKRIAASLVAASVAMGHAQPVFADGGDAIAGAIVGAIIGGAIVNENNKKRYRTSKTRSSTSGVSSAQREQNREVQTALNYFGYPVGTPDGSLGPKSRSAIGEYQATLGYAPTGQLTDYERTFLVGSYQRAMAGGSLTLQQAAQNPMGMRGLLLAWRDEAAGVSTQAATAVAPVAPLAPVAPAANAANPFAPQPAAPADSAGATMAAVEPAPAEAAPGLPSFLGNGTPGQSLASFCNKVGLVTSTNGGYTTVASMSDPMQALGEQFCLSRGYAIALGEDMASQVSGFTPDQIAAQCDGFGPAMQGQIAALSLRPRAEVMQEVEKFALSTGMSPQQLSGTAKICLSAGYKSDKMDVAVASALILASLGEGAYGELLGHHLSQGFGATQRPDLALDWYQQGLDAAANTSTAVFAPGQTDRLELIRKASLMVAGKPEQAALPEVVPAALPTFQPPAAPAEPAAMTDQAAVAPAPVAPAQDMTALTPPDAGAVDANAFVADTAAAEPAPAAEAPAMAVAEAPAAVPSSKVDALPFMAQLPFLLFRN